MPVGPVRRDEQTAEFFDGTSRGELLLRHCPACGAASEPQAGKCGHCSNAELGWCAAAGDATLVTWTVSYSKPGLDATAARTVLGVAQLSEGPWWWTQIVADPDQLRVGMPLQLTFEQPDGGEAVPVFVVADEGAR
jgi:uncharacterized OB-fold protein